MYYRMICLLIDTTRERAPRLSRKSTVTWPAITDDTLVFKDTKAIAISE